MIRKWLTQGNQELSSYTNGRDSYITKDSIIPSQLLIFMVGQVVISFTRSHSYDNTNKQGSENVLHKMWKIPQSSKFRPRVDQ